MHLPLAALETPCPVVDLDRLSVNLDRMAAHTAALGLGLRPHVKTHKTHWIAAEQLKRGAVGLTCATLAEVETMSDLTGDLLLAHPPVHPEKLRRLMDLPPSVRPMVAIDSADAVDRVAQATRSTLRTIRVLVELDLGMHRVGVQSAEQAVALARHVHDNVALEFVGVMFYPGHIKGRVEEQGDAIAKLGRDLGDVIEALEQADLKPEIVSGGSTPTAPRTGEIVGLTEIRPGTYVYNDRITVATGTCGRDACALTVLATVVSTAVPGQAVVDAGSKALGREPFAGVAGFGELLDRPEVTVNGMSEEHGLLDLSRTDWRPSVGDQVRIIPNHVCIVVHLNDVVYGLRNGEIATSWPVTARGRGFAVL